MEPVKGGALADLPKEAAEVLRNLGDKSQASYALRYAASYPEVFMVLSGMGNWEMMNDNISFMKNFEPLNDAELAAVRKVAAIYHGEEQIPCTACRYCVDGCPQEIAIPDLFAAVNKAKMNGDTADLSQIPGGNPADCVNGRKCEQICPQFLPIRALLRKIAKDQT